VEVSTSNRAAAYDSQLGPPGWRRQVETGEVIDGPLGNRPQYGPTYHSACLLDPDGHRVEVAVGTD
jgi:hypothetical protein